MLPEQTQAVVQAMLHSNTCLPMHPDMFDFKQQKCERIGPDSFPLFSHGRADKLSSLLSPIFGLWLQHAYHLGLHSTAWRAHAP